MGIYKTPSNSWCARITVLGKLIHLGTFKTEVAAARAHDANLLVVVIDNNGGGIFDMLPLAESLSRESFERHFGTPHGLDLPELLSGFGIPCRTVARAKELRAVVRESLSHHGIEVVRVVTDREENADLHRRLFAAAEAAVLPEV